MGEVISYRNDGGYIVGGSVIGFNFLFFRKNIVYLFFCFLGSLFV